MLLFWIIIGILLKRHISFLMKVDVVVVLMAHLCRTIHLLHNSDRKGRSNPKSDWFWLEIESANQRICVSAFEVNKNRIIHLTDRFCILSSILGSTFSESWKLSSYKTLPQNWDFFFFLLQDSCIFISCDLGSRSWFYWWNEMWQIKKLWVSLSCLKLKGTGQQNCLK